MDVFRLRNSVIHDYAEYVRSFVRIREARLRHFVEQSLADQSLWPQPLIQMNPSFESGGWIDDLVNRRMLHPECQKIFRIKTDDDVVGEPMRLHRHQLDAIEAACSKANYVLTTGTSSGKSLAYLIPIVDQVLRTGRGQGVQAIVVYPMNALCNSQFGELGKFLCIGYGEGKQPVRFGRYTGQEDQEKRDQIIQNPPDILLTNYVMLELLLTRPFERSLVNAARGLKFLVLDELHTYRGRQGADVALLVRRVREACEAPDMLCVGTSATMASGGTYAQQRGEIAKVASRLFGVEVKPDHVIGETLTRATPAVDFRDQQTLSQLRQNVTEDQAVPTSYDAFVQSPMASWLESHFGLDREAGSDWLKRAQPRPIIGDCGAATALSTLVGLAPDVCEAAIRRWLLAGYHCEVHPDTKAKPFACTNSSAAETRFSPPWRRTINGTCR